jgi:hypothetical protein
VPPSLAWKGNQLETASESQTPGTTASITATQSFCVDFLSELAHEVCPDVDSATKEALQEAMRLHRMKTIASKYGIVGLDPRNSRQVRSVISIISSQVHGQDPIKDVLEFLDAWSTGYYVFHCE